MTAGIYRHKPVMVQAMQVPPAWDGKGSPDGIATLALWLGIGGRWAFNSDFSIKIFIPGGSLQVSPGEWIIKDPTGRLHYCDDATFKDRYEAVKQ